MDELSIDKECVLKFLKKYGILFLLVVLLGLNIWIRMTPYYLPVTDSWAEQSLNQNAKNYFGNEILQQYPNLPADVVDEQASEKLGEFVNSPEYVLQVAELSNMYKDEMRTEEGIPYLHEIDPYFWYRHSLNVIDHGSPGDYEKDGVQYTSFRLAPTGNDLGPDEFNSYVMAYWGLFMGLFGLSVFGAAYFIPVFLTCLALIPAFFIGKRVGGNLTGFLAGLIILTNTMFLARTPAGFADTDAYTVLCPLLIIWAVTECFYSKGFRGELFWAGLAGFFVGVFGWAWIGWSFAYDLVLGALFFYGVYLLITKKKGMIRYHLTRSVTFFFSASAFLFLFRDWKSVWAGPFSFLWFVKLQDVASTKIWPNVLTTVAEQNLTNVSTIMNVLGGKIFVLFAVAGLVYLFKDKRYFFFVLSLLWMAATVFAGTRGTRYVQLSLPVFAILVAVGIFWAYELVVKHTPKIMNVSSTYVKIGLVIVIMILFLAFPVQSAKYQVNHAIPEFNDAWHETLSVIAEDSPPDAIISSWWDWGHWFKAIGERGVTFDGTSQDTPQAHWIGKVLLTTDEAEAVNILAMLNCDGNEAFDEFTAKRKVDPISEGLQAGEGYNIITDCDDDSCEYGFYAKPMTQLDAVAKVYEWYVDGTERRCDNPRSSIFITSKDMVYKAPVWAHFGSWNFTKAQIVQDVKRTGFSSLASPDEVARISSMNEQDINSFISPWPQYMGEKQPCEVTNETKYYCHNQGMPFSFDVLTEQFNASFVPANIGYVSNGTFHLVSFSNYTERVGVTLSNQGFNIFSDPLLTGSMFNRLFFLDGEGLERFTKFHEVTSFKGEYISTWEVNLEKY